MYICTHTYIHTRIHMHAHTYTCAYARVRVFHECVCVYVDIYNMIYIYASITNCTINKQEIWV